MSTLGTVSTCDVSPREKFAFWEDSLWRLCGKLRAEMQADVSFGGKLEYAKIGDVTIAKLTASPHCLVRTPSFIAPESNDFLKVVLQMKGPSCFEQGTRKVDLSPCEWSVYDTKQAYCVTVPQDTETLVAILPRDNVETHRIHLDDLLLRKFSGSEGMGKLAVQFMVSAFDEIPVITPESEWEIAGAISNLIRFTMLAASEIQTQLSLRQVWRDRIQSYILSHLRDPELSIDKIAAAMNCTKRYVHKIFQSETASVSELILHMRLARCREDLLNSARAHSSVTEIAYSWGFNNPAHFSRAFKEEFKISPSLFRMEARACGSSLPNPGVKGSSLTQKLLKLREDELSSYS